MGINHLVRSKSLSQNPVATSGEASGVSSCEVRLTEPRSTQFFQVSFSGRHFGLAGWLVEHVYMENLVRGIHKFQTTQFGEHRDLFKQLSAGQSPETLIITCSDSRIAPNLILQTKPGELFVLRNAGNIIPPYGAARGGEGATIEYALKGLNIGHIVVMGHSHCGAMKGLLHPEDLEGMPLVKDWLTHASATREILNDCYSDLTGEELLNAAIKENVLVQLDNLRTYPVVAARLAKGELTLHGWVYEFETGKIFAFDPKRSQFAPITSYEVPPTIATRYAQEKRIHLAAAAAEAI
jgi:carbonic anhydrase